MATYFISGHRDLTDKEFYLHYKKTIMNSVLADPKSSFVVGDYWGADLMAQEYLASLKKKYTELNITVYHMFEEPRNNPCGLPTKGGFTSDHDRDSAMTLVSDKDIAWVRAGKKYSGTAQNLLRRKVKELVLDMKFKEAADLMKGLLAMLSIHPDSKVDAEIVYKTR